MRAWMVMVVVVAASGGFVALQARAGPPEIATAAPLEALGRAPERLPQAQRAYAPHAEPAGVPQAEPVDAPQAEPRLTSDNAIAQLIDRTENQVADGRVWAPTGDNALETVRQILLLVPAATPDAVAEVNAIPGRLRQRAAIEDAAGRIVEARRFVLFADALISGGTGQKLASRTNADMPSVRLIPSREPPAPPAPAAAAPAQAAPPVATPRGAGHAGPPVPPPAMDAAAEAAGGAASNQLPASVLAALMRRGDAMLAIGDISAARLLYEHAARAGNASAAAALGRTHDPEVLAGLGTRGMQPDLATALIWYRRAAALGDAGAADRLRRQEANGVK